MSNALSDRRRLAALRRTGLFEAPPSEALDRLTKLATRMLGVPISTATLVDDRRQFFAAQTGVDDPWKSERGTPLPYSFCQHVVTGGRPLVVEDARTVDFLKDSPAIPELKVVAYAGVPLKLESGEVLGSFCAIENHPRSWSEADLDALKTLADAAMSEINLREATRLLGERERQLEILLDNSEELVCSFGVRGEITYVNRAWRETLGYTTDEAMGLRPVDLVAPEFRDSFLAVVNRLRGGTGVESYEAELIAKDGRRVYCRGRAMPAVGGDGVARIDALFFDITAAREAERARAAADKMKNELIGLVSHELRGPLTTIRGALKIMDAQQSEDSKTRQLTSMASRGADRLLRLVDDLLDIERAESGQLKLEKRVVSIETIFADVRDATHAQAETAGVEVRYHQQDGETVTADPDRLVQVITNLVGNALKFSPRDSTVTVSSRSEGKATHIEVRDQGRGIPIDKLDAIFERFKQVTVEDATVKKGAGLGLAICRAIVEQHGGRIWAENNAGGGASFHVTIPTG